jgi:sec-independent protein translocase protein TatC
MAFAYFVALPLIFKFIIATAPIGVSVMTDINQYMDFVLSLFFAFGMCFQVPIATILLVASGLVSRNEMVEKRPYIILLAFIVGAVLTPPDVLSQTLLAVPIWLLFEVGLFFSRLLVPRHVP